MTTSWEKLAKRRFSPEERLEIRISAIIELKELEEMEGDIQPSFEGVVRFAIEHHPEIFDNDKVQQWIDDPPPLEKQLEILRMVSHSLFGGT